MILDTGRDVKIYLVLTISNKWANLTFRPPLGHITFLTLALLSRTPGPLMHIFSLKLSCFRVTAIFEIDYVFHSLVLVIEIDTFSK